jgi:hypothetical protein
MSSSFNDLGTYEVSRRGKSEKFDRMTSNAASSHMGAFHA